MLERLQRPFLTVETGEAYQAIRLVFEIQDETALLDKLSSLKCVLPVSSKQLSWYWRDEVESLPFSSLDSLRILSTKQIRLASLSLKESRLYIQFQSFKRACMGLTFFREQLKNIATPHHADFVNKIFGLDERLPHGFTELFQDSELEELVQERLIEFEKVNQACEDAASAEEALAILKAYSEKESQKRLPYTERYLFEPTETDIHKVMDLSFFIFLRSRELVAIKRWLGEDDAHLSKVFENSFLDSFGEYDAV